MLKETNNNKIPELIADFLTGSANDIQLMHLKHWLEENPSHVDEFGKIRSAWILANYQQGKTEYLPNWTDISTRIHPKKRTIIRYFKPLKYIASFAAFFVLGAVLMNWWNRFSESQLLTSQLPITISIPLGSKGTITLPDGSKVWLNAGSTITYSPDFGREERNLSLSGEAFFDVKSDSLIPFKVNTDGMTVRAFGTRFNVKAYPGDPILSATLEKGKIDVELHASKGTNGPIHLAPNEKLEVSKIASDTKSKQLISIDEIRLIPQFDTKLSTSWKDPKWIIRDEALSIFVTDLGRRYNLNIELASDELKKLKFTGTIENETAEQIFAALAIAAPVSYTFNKNNVVLSINKQDKNKFDKILKRE